MLRYRRIVVVAVAGLALAGCGPKPHQQTYGAQWVALGDSYSSGEGSGGAHNLDFDAKTNARDPKGYVKHRHHLPLSYESLDPAYPYNNCHRSKFVWSRLLTTDGGRSDLEREPFDLVHVACSGAVVDNVWFAGKGDMRQGSTVTRAGHRVDPLAVDCTKEPVTPTTLCKRYHYVYEKDYQIKALTPATKLVTISIGGNDIGFGDIGQGCVLAEVKHDHANILSKIPSGVPIPTWIRQYFASKEPANCQAAMAAAAKADPSAVADPLDAIAHLGPKLRGVYQAILDAAPNAYVLVVGYPNVVSADTAAKDSLADCPVIASDRAWLSGVLSALNDSIRGSVAAVAADNSNRIRFVDESHAFDGHQLCGIAHAGRGQKYENGVVDIWNGLWAKVDVDHPTIGNDSFHPTVAGYRAVARPVMAAIDQLRDPSATAEGGPGSQ